MSPRTADCPHDLRPGLTVCLHCRRAAREAKSARIRRILSRTTFGIVGFALCVGIGYVGANSLESGGTVRRWLASAAELVSRAQAAVPRSSRRAPEMVAHAPAVAPSVTPPVVQHQLVALVMDSTPSATTPAPVIDSAASATTTQDLPLTTSQPEAPAPPPASAAPVPATLAPVVTVAAAPTPRYAPSIASGRTELGGDGMYAVRDGDVVRVHFDTELGRTRRGAKFEQIVRATLPRVLGPAADSLLRQVPPGRIAGRGDLITDLPQRGVELRHIDGRSLTVWPETRPGRDGPIVISYRVTTTH